MKRVFLLALLVGVVSTLGPFALQAAGPGRAVRVTCGDTISAPGNYVLAGDCSGQGILITASNVVFMLQGHTMTGPGALSEPLISGIDVGGGGGSTNVQIIGPGTIQNYWVGIFFGAQGTVSGSSVAHVEASHNGYAGMETYFGNNGNVFEHNVTRYNLFNGIAIYPDSTGNVIAHNHSSDNGNDLADFNDPPCAYNDWEHNVFGHVDQQCIQ
jgi:hypothetical protein